MKCTFHNIDKYKIKSYIEKYVKKLNYFFHEKPLIDYLLNFPAYFRILLPYILFSLPFLNFSDFFCFSLVRNFTFSPSREKKTFPKSSPSCYHQTFFPKIYQNRLL